MVLKHMSTCVLLMGVQMCTSGCVKGRSLHWVDCLSQSLHLTFFFFKKKQNLPLNLDLTNSERRDDFQEWVVLFFYVYGPGVTAIPLCLDLYMGSGEWNLSLHACMTSMLVLVISLASQHALWVSSFSTVLAGFPYGALDISVQD